MFTSDEKMQLLNRLPALELSYEPKLHKKVYSTLYYIIPKGPKALIWYTYWKEQNVCLLIKINERGNYSDIQPFLSAFADPLALGTIIYGTYFLHSNRHYFTCEQLYYYKGLGVAKKPYKERLNLLIDMFTGQVEQVAYTATSLVVGLPIMTETYEEALAQLEQPYKTYGIAAVNNEAVRKAMPIQATYNMPMPIQSPIQAMPITKSVFKVKACLAADNYQLYTMDDIFYDTALISTYKCSVLMNTLFRNIKENANLDLLEESDDETEFENIQIDKFVDLDKTILMECVYSKRFKKWQPVKVVLNKAMAYVKKN
jgi:hypothetical protein